MNAKQILKYDRALENARRLILEESQKDGPPILDSPEKIDGFMQVRCAGLKLEKFWILCLNRKNRLIECVEITSGTASSCLVHPREVFRPAVLHAASAIVCVHNHPSGDPAPSMADIKVTRQLRDAANVMGIDLLDHLIVGRKALDPANTGFYSFSEKGLL
jgi:DNA repair protein RadC